MSHLVLRMAVVAALLGGLAASASAGGWYYKWSCAGRCSPGQLTIQGIEGPFPNEEECNRVRDHDTRSSEFVSEGNLGGLQSCEYIGDSGGPSGGGAVAAGAPSSPPNQLQIDKREYGVSLGTGWRTRQAGAEFEASKTLSIDAAMHTGRRAFGGMMTLGLQLSDVSAPALGAGEHAYAVIPLLVGLRITPRIAGGAGWHLRLDLAASAGGFFQLTCSGCAGGALDETLAFGYTLEAGVTYFFSADTGVSLRLVSNEWVMSDGSSGVEVQTPPWMLRLALAQLE